MKKQSYQRILAVLISLMILLTPTDVWVVFF